LPACPGAKSKAFPNWRRKEGLRMGEYQKRFGCRTEGPGQGKKTRGSESKGFSVVGITNWKGGERHYKNSVSCLGWDEGWWRVGIG